MTKYNFKKVVLIIHEDGQYGYGEGAQFLFTVTVVTKKRIFCHHITSLDGYLGGSLESQARRLGFRARLVNSLSGSVDKNSDYRHYFYSSNASDALLDIIARI